MLKKDVTNTYAHTSKSLKICVTSFTNVSFESKIPLKFPFQIDLCLRFAMSKTLKCDEIWTYGNEKTMSAA